jgi:hypothetical protein
MRIWLHSQSRVGSHALLGGGGKCESSTLGKAGQLRRGNPSLGPVGRRDPPEHYPDCALDLTDDRPPFEGRRPLRIAKVGRCSNRAPALITYQRVVASRSGRVMDA